MDWIVTSSHRDEVFLFTFFRGDGTEADFLRCSITGHWLGDHTGFLLCCWYGKQHKITWAGKEDSSKLSAKLAKQPTVNRTISTSKLQQPGVISVAKNHSSRYKQNGAKTTEILILYDRTRRKKSRTRIQFASIVPEGVVWCCVA